MRVDRFFSNLPRFNRQQVRLLLVQGRIRIDGQVVRDSRADVTEFSRVELDAELLQEGKRARYFMLHKPQGCVSATQDPEHATVLDLIHEPDKHELHIAGRLDYNTTGLMLITNDGQWSRRLTQPQTKLPKLYYVETEQPLGPGVHQHLRPGPVLCLRRPDHPARRSGNPRPTVRAAEHR